MKMNYSRFIWFLVVTYLVVSCIPKEPVVFKSVNNLTVDLGINGEPVLKGDAIFYNPNKVQTKLKEINVEVLVDGKKAATVDQNMDLLVKAKSDFTVPIEAKLDLKKFGLLDAVIGFFGGKTYNIEMMGFLRVNVHGVTVKVPVKYNEEVKLNR
jgi:LEA14-like dessication related protein